jgi:hypothetical protein
LLMGSGAPPSEQHEKRVSEMREKVLRNGDKCAAAGSKLAAETKSLLDSFESVEMRRKILATERCEGVRALLQVRENQDTCQA